MTPCLANWTPDVPGEEPLPNTKAPPWIHTMTGSFAPGAAAAGRHTLMNRQSSDEVGEIAADAACEARLRTIRAELARITLSLPRGQGLRRAPAIGADRRGRIGNPLEAGDIPFGHAAHDSGGGTNRLGLRRDRRGAVRLLLGWERRCQHYCDGQSPSTHRGSAYGPAPNVSCLFLQELNCVRPIASQV